MNKEKKFWETCKRFYAHLDYNNFESCKKIYVPILKNIDFKEKIVIDYGCGGGWMGQMLFDKFEIKKYIGIDIAQRSLKVSRETLQVYKNVELFEIPVNFKSFNADIFISFSCIQHFSNEKFLIDFLNNLNNSNIKNVIIQIRYSGKKEFNGNYNIDGGNVGITCSIDENYALIFLSNYKLMNLTELNTYKFLNLELK